MSSIDPNVARVLDQHRDGPQDDIDEDDLIAELEEETDDNTTLAALREKRLQQLHAEMARARVMRDHKGHGTYTEIREEKQILDITTSTPRCVVHFMKPDFNRCRIMDEKLDVLAEKHFDTRFVSINVDSAPFLVVKLGIQVLPCVIAFKDGVSADRIIGFEGIGWRPDSFTLAELEARLLACGVLVRAKMTDDDNDRYQPTRGSEQQDDDEDFDDDE